jgi:RNA 2',3'-cyclic 3'-phosphodiesterase
MRQFIAIPLPENVKQEIEQLLKNYREVEGLRFVKPENLHLTLVFLGDMETEGLIEKVRKVSFSPFNISTRSVELFPEGKPRLIWIELNQPAELSELRKELADIFNIDEKFRAHVTVARIKRLTGQTKRTLQEITGQQNPFVMNFHVSRFNLYNSEPGHGGHVYRVTESFPANTGST